MTSKPIISFSRNGEKLERGDGLHVLNVYLEAIIYFYFKEFKKFYFFIISRADHLLIIDLGRYSVSTQLCQQPSIEESTTLMELEECLYSKILLKCSDVQILFCDNKDNWRDAKKENETQMHIVSKTNFQSIFAVSAMDIKTLPR